MSSEWIQVGAVAGIDIGGATVVRHEGRQIAVFRIGESDFRAVDNLCPHEGYPLVQGYVKDCVLTCAWHNFKFDLRDGRCVQGDEDVRSYPVRVVDGALELELALDSSAAVGAAEWASLRAGLRDRRMPRVARDVARMLQAGVASAELLMFAVCYDAEYAEYGSTHALPVAADLLGLLADFDGMTATLPIMQAMEQAAEDSVRREPRPVPAPIDPGGERDIGVRLCRLVEAEDLTTAEALLRGAIRGGATRGDVEPWFFRLVCGHFLGFGHSTIYVVKVFDLLDRTDWKHAELVLSALLYSIGTSTREDTLPTMTWLGELLAEWGGEFGEYLANSVTDWDRDEFVELVLSGKRQDVAHGLRDALVAGVAPSQLVDAISLAAAHRMLRFDVAIDGDPTVREGWLDLTHGLTFAQATRVALSRYREPSVLRLLFFAAHFVNRTAPLDLPEARRTPWHELPSVSADEIRERVMDAVFGDRYVRPIVVAHVLKTGLAAMWEHTALGADSQANVPLLAVRRLIESPLRERQVRRNSEEAVRFIGDGKPPRRLTTAP